MSRRLKLLGFAAVVVVVAATFYLVHLRRSLGSTGRTEEQARREVLQLQVVTPSDKKGNARMYWASAITPGTLEPIEMQLALSSDPGQRAKQLLNALIASPPSPQERTLPADVTLIEFYLPADGTAIADFSDALATAMPSGILSEQMAVDSIAKTLGANMEKIQRIKILIHGQEVETLAGHVDLTGTFPVHTDARLTPVPTAAPGKTPASGLTAPSAPGKLRK
jgi:hypothetical protein